MDHTSNRITQFGKSKFKFKQKITLFPKTPILLFLIVGGGRAIEEEGLAKMRKIF